MAFNIVLPNSLDPEDTSVTLDEEFETFEEAIEWAAEFFDIDEEGKIIIIREYKNSEEMEGF